MEKHMYNTSFYTNQWKKINRKLLGILKNHSTELFEKNLRD